MYFLNVIDEKGRYKDLKVYLGRDGQSDSHTYSYLYIREQLKIIYKKMGFDRLSELEEKIKRW